MNTPSAPNSILRRPGGKARLVKDLLPLLPEHTCYVEVFAGGAALLRAKEPSTVEVLNDTASEITNAFRCVRFHHREVIRELDFQVNSREDFFAYREQPGLTDIQRAARWLFLNALSFGGDSDSFGVQRTCSGGGASNSLTNLQARLFACKQRLERVVIESLDWRKCLKTYDSPETLFFCDPPYVGGDIRSYAAWTQEQMAEFAAAIQRVKGKWVLTVNDSPENRALFAFGKQKRLKRARCIANRNADERQQYGELIVSQS